MGKNLAHSAGRFANICIITLGILLGGALSQSSADDKASLTDYDWQALYIVKFGLSYVEWPEMVYSGTIKNVSICVFGDSPAFLKSLEGFQKKVESKIKITVKQPDGDSLTGCNIAYIARGKRDYKNILTNAARKPVLTVAPISGFVSSGGIVEFIISETSEGAAPLNSKVKVNFRINNKAATAVDLKVAPELLELADEVIR